MKKAVLFLITILFINLSYAQKEHKEYYDNGDLKKIGKYDSDGNGTGEWKFYHKNGQLRKIGKYKIGKQTGEWKIYHENGQLEAIGKIENGKSIGEWKYYHGNGKLQEIGKYKNGKQTGEWKYYHDNGKLRGIGKWENGKKIGEWKYYHDNGKLRGMGKWENGKKMGKWKSYHDNGQLQEIVKMENGNPTGEWKSYHDNGQLEEIGKYENGKKTSKWRYYHKNGQLEKIRKHENGKKVDGWNIKELAAELKPKIESDINKFLFLEEGKPYLITSRKNLTSSSAERVVLIFFGDKYIIYTVPDVVYARRLFKDKVVFKSIYAKSGKVLINKKIKRNGTKKEVTFKKSLHYSHIFLGGWGDELIWTKGQQSLEFDTNLYYYYWYNSLNCDVDLKKSFSKHRYNPYIETGTITKTIDYELVQDNTLLMKLKNAGVSNKTSNNLNNPEVLKIKLIPSNNIKMLFPVKKIRYKMVDKIKAKYINKNIEYKGKYLYFTPKTKVNHYGFIQYNKSYPESNLMSSIAALTNSYKMSKSKFSSFYKSFNKNAGNGKPRYFTDTNYKDFFELIPTIIEGNK
jgi:antitoxin component YwqK of YwqJK toxin-antitoxin module